MRVTTDKINCWKGPDSILILTHLSLQSATFHKCNMTLLGYCMSYLITDNIKTVLIIFSIIQICMLQV